MSDQEPPKRFKRLNLLSLSIPISILIAAAALSLQPVVRQALIGIMVIWFGVEAMTGFEWWQ